MEVPCFVYPIMGLGLLSGAEGDLFTGYGVVVGTGEETLSALLQLFAWWFRTAQVTVYLCMLPLGRGHSSHVT